MIENKIDLVVSFDTTGSMYPVLAQVRREVEQFVKTMFTEFTDLRLGIIAHGDYCDKDNPYTIRVMELTRNESELCKFVRETEKTYGGDADECYELVLNTAHKVFKWRDEADKIMLMIGDASPHSPSYPQNKEKLDWKNEAEELRKNGIKVFSVHALAGYRSSSKAFYKHVAETTGGIYLTLDMFNEIVDLIKATCYQQSGEERLNEYITIVKEENRLTNSLDINFRRLKGEAIEEVFGSPRGSSYSSYRTRKSSGTTAGKIKELAELEPVAPGRFQTFTVPSNIDIKGFVTSMGIEFKKGRGFYELSKAETVQQYKEVIIQDRETGEMFVGSQVRKELGLQPQTEKGGVNERIHKDATEKYRVFIQSTSVNRKLIGGTTFLYEVSDIEDTGTVIEETEVTVKKPEKPKKKTEERELILAEGKSAILGYPSKVKDTSIKEVADTPIEEVAKGKFDTKVVKDAISKSEKKGTHEHDSLTEEAILSAKKGKRGKSLKKLASESKLDSIEIEDLTESEETYKEEASKEVKSTKKKSRTKKVSKETEEVKSLATSALDEVKKKKDSEQKEAEEKLAAKKKAEAEKRKVQREREKARKEKLAEQKRVKAERAKALAEKERQKKEAEAAKKKAEQEAFKKAKQIQSKAKKVAAKAKVVLDYTTGLSNEEKLSPSKTEWLKTKFDELSELMNELKETL